MSQKPISKVLTANSLVAGDVIYLTQAATWSRRFEEAQLFTDSAQADAQLALAKAQQGLLVDAYLADATQGPDGPVPTHFREAFRATGPSNYAHGKQAEL